VDRECGDQRRPELHQPLEVGHDRAQQVTLGEHADVAPILVHDLRSLARERTITGERRFSSSASRRRSL
jgi:hypothetical protein